jgi:hypothetical protein
MNVEDVYELLVAHGLRLERAPGNMLRAEPRAVIERHPELVLLIVGHKHPLLHLLREQIAPAADPSARPAARQVEEQRPVCPQCGRPSDRRPMVSDN